MNQPPEVRPLDAAETDALRARQQARNKVLGLILGFLVVLFFAISIVKITAKPRPAPAEAAEQAERS